MTYGISATVPLSFEAAIAAITEALKTQGFGILTTIDVKATLKQKLNVDFKPYTILGACNPPLAYQALQAEPEVGLLLPCNIIIYDNLDGSSTVSILDPQQMMSVASNLALRPVAAQARERLEKALAALTNPSAFSADAGR